jgi:hypothetical protein
VAGQARNTEKISQGNSGENVLNTRRKNLPAKTALTALVAAVFMLCLPVGSLLVAEVSE